MGHEERFPPPRLNGRCRFGQATFTGTHGNERDAPFPDLSTLTPENRQVRRVTTFRIVEYGYSLLRQAGQSQAGDVDFENFRGRKVSVLSIPGDGQLGEDCKHSRKLGAGLIEPAEMRQRGDFDPHRGNHARLVVQGAVGPFDRLFEASRGEMSDSDITRVEKVYGSNGLKRRARSMASIAASGWLRHAWILPLAHQA